MDNKTFACGAWDFDRPRCYILDIFPYPSGNGLYVEHPEDYTTTDIVCYMKRMQGHNVLHSMGRDAFELPAEQFATTAGNYPAKFAKMNTDHFRKQIRALGFSYDWGRGISTMNPNYYKWTQWIFLKLCDKGLTYVDEISVNWCPELETVLADEEVIDGKSERGGFPVIRKPMR